MNRDERIYKLKNGSETAGWAAKEIERLEERTAKLESLLFTVHKDLSLRSEDGVVNISSSIWISLEEEINRN